MTSGKSLALRVEVPTPPAAGLLRAAIERRLAGAAFPSGPEDAVARAVADAVREQSASEPKLWR